MMHMHENETKKMKNVNDYSRFDKIEASDSEGGEDDDEEEPKKHTIEECMSVANAHKECGNKYFKGDDFVNAIDSYAKGIWALKHFSAKKAEKLDNIVLISVTTLLVSLHGNSAQVYLKTQQWGKAIASASCVLQLDAKNVKAMYRRSIAYGRDGLFDDAKADLNKILEIDPTNAAARKELIELSKNFKRHNEKEKVAFFNMFSKGTMYNDDEMSKIRQMKEQQDRWMSSKLDRRAKGLKEWSFEEWLKEVDSGAIAGRKGKKAKKKRNKDKAVNAITAIKSDSSSDKENPRMLQKSTAALDAKTNTDNCKSFDEDIKILNESRTNCMNDNQANIGTPSPEERDVNEMTEVVKAKIVDMFSSEVDGKPDVTLPAIDASNPSSLSASLLVLQEGMSNTANHSPKENVDRLTASMSQVDVSIIGIPSVHGHVRIPSSLKNSSMKKKKWCYAFVVTVLFEIVMTSILPPFTSPSKDENISIGTSKDRSSNPIKKFKGSLLFRDVSPGSDLESSVTYKKTVPIPFADRVNEAVRSLQSKLSLRFRDLEKEVNPS